MTRMLSSGGEEGWCVSEGAMNICLYVSVMWSLSYNRDEASKQLQRLVCMQYDT